MASPWMTVSMISKSHSIEMHIEMFFDLVNLTFDLWPWPTNLTYKLDLQTWPRYLFIWPPCQKSSLSVCPFTRYSGMRRTHRHTLDDVKTFTPDTSQMQSVITMMLPSQIQTVLSLLHVANRLPLIHHAALFTSFSCPSSVAVHSNSPPKIC